MNRRKVKKLYRKIFNLAEISSRLLLILILISWTLGIFYWLPFMEPAKAATFQMQTGYYMGTGNDNFAISGVGFQPNLVLISRSDSTNDLGDIGGAVMKTSSMGGETSAFMSGTADATSDYIQSLDSNGFTVGADLDVNATEVRRIWAAFGGSDCTASGTFCVGSYTGNGTGSTNISTGFQPSFVLVKQSSTQRGIIATNNLLADSKNAYANGGTLGSSSGITALNASSFTLSSNNSVNQNAQNYWFFAFKSVSGALATGVYTGDGTGNRAITGAGFQPDMVLMVDGWNSFFVNESYAYTSYFGADAFNGTHIQTIDSDGFSVDSNDNANGTVYYYMAFGGVVDPTPSGTFQSSTGSYSGTGVAQSISGLGFQPDLVIIKHSDQATDQDAVFRTKLMPGNFTVKLTRYSYDFTGGITSLDADGFSVGTHATVNTSGDTYYWEAFGNAFDPLDGAGAADFSIGIFHGMYNDGDGMNIVRTGMQPNLVVIKGDGWGSTGTWRTSLETTDNSYFFSASADAADHIQQFNADGFQVGLMGSTINQDYYWFSFKSGNNFKVNSYTGNGAARSITGVGWQPDMLWVKRSTAVAGVFRPSTLTGNSAQYFNNTANASGLITSLDADGFSLGTDTTVNANTGSYRYAAWNFKTYNQSAYRWFANADSTDVGAAAAAQDTAYSMTSDGAAVRLRALLHIGGGNLYASNQNFKLQFVGKGAGTCASPSGGTPATYTDIDGTTAIAYKNNATPADGANLTLNANDPTHGAHTVQAQTYEESNNFTNSTSAITIGQDGKWDFALYDNTAPNNTTYCLRAVLSDGTALGAYDQYMQISSLPNSVPVATTPASILQSADDTGKITFSTTISDANSENTKLKVEYSDNGGTDWYAPDLVSVTPSSASVDLDDAQTYQIGSVNAIDTSAGSITLTIVWDTQSALNGNGSLDSTVQSDIKVRVTPNDSIADGTAQASTNFEVDNLNPTASGNLTVSARATDSITYTLGAAGSDTNISNYKIYYKQAASGVAETDTLQVTIATASYTAGNTTQIASLSANTQYVVNIWTYDSYGNKANATELAAYTYAPQVTGVAVVNATDVSIYKARLSWAYASGTPTGLKIEQDTGCDGYDTTVYDNASALLASPYTVSGLSPKVCYKFRFSSYNLGGNLNTTSSPETSQVTMPPAQPTGLTAVAQTTNSITWDWNDVSQATDYKIYLNDGTLVGNVGTTTSQYVHPGLIINTQYSVYVRAEGSDEGIASATTSAYTASGSGASIPVSLSHDASSQTTSAMKWTWASGGSQKDYYASTAAPADNSSWTTNIYWNQSGLSANTAVTLSVKARDDSLVETAPAQVTAYTAQNVPTGISKSALSVSSLTLTANGTFSNLTTASSGLYFENVSEGTNSGWTQTNAWASSSLLANRQYSFRVKARNGDSDETSTASANYFTAQNAPTGISKSALAADSITFTADGSLSNLTSGTAGLYFENTTTSTNSNWLQTNSWNSGSLSANTQYGFRVKARNGDSVETTAATANYYTAQNTPTGVSAATTALNYITVTAAGTFTNLTTGNSGLYFENVTAGTNSGWIQVNSWQSAGLTAGTFYSFRVKARNAEGVETSFSTANNLNTLSIAGDNQKPPEITTDTETITYQCGDGKDNDADSYVDYPMDLGCESASDDSEYNLQYPPPVLSEPKDGSLLNNNQPYVIGTTYEGALAVKIFIDDVNAYQLLSQSDKSFVWKTSPALSEGQHTIYVGSGGAYSKKHTIVVDTVAPESPLINLIQVKSVASFGEKINSSLTVQGETKADAKYVMLYIDGAIYIDTVAVSANNWSYDFSAILTPGGHKISVKAIDLAGNMSVVPNEKSFEVALITEEKPIKEEEKEKVEKKPVEEKIEPPVEEKQPVEETEEELIEEKKPIKEAPIEEQPVKVIPKKEAPTEIAPVEIGEEKPGTLLPVEVEVSAPVSMIKEEIIMAAIENKPEWEKTDDEKAFELAYETEKIMESAVVEKIIGGLAPILSDLTGISAEAAAEQVKQGISAVVKTTKKVKQATLDNRVVEKVNDTAKQPAMAVVTATSAAAVATVGATGVSGASMLTYLQFLFAQPFFLLARKKKFGWGVIYNTATKQPVDLAVVRVYNADTHKLVGTRVTDRQGRYEFILNPGKYFLVAAKKELKFPSTLLGGEKSDGRFEDLYFGGDIEITEKQVIGKNIPLDPHKMVKKAKAELAVYFVRRAQTILILVGPALAIISLAVNPSWWVGGVTVAQIVMYGIFKKLGLGEKPKSWGVVKDIEKKSAIARSIIRVFDTRFNKLLDSQITDGKGRYAFLVGNEEYYMTAEKIGYYPKRTARYNLSGEKSGYLVDDFYLRPHHLGKEVEQAQAEDKPVTLRMDLGRTQEIEVDGAKRLVRKEEERFTESLKEINQNELHEDFYRVDPLAKND